MFCDGCMVYKKNYISMQYTYCDRLQNMQFIIGIVWLYSIPIYGIICLLMYISLICIHFLFILFVGQVPWFLANVRY